MPSVNINGKSIFYTDSPQEDNGSPRLTTVLIHGLGSSSCFYHPIIPQLQPVSRCLALDTPGSGLSTLGATEQSITTIADDILAFLDAVDVKGEVVVVGHSMGGILASRLAATKPERVRGVVLVGPVNPSAGAAKAFEDRIAAVKKGVYFTPFLPLFRFTLSCVVHLFLFQQF
jgi:pimeloyl-ACP methyl ester carboxylesterase